MDAEATHQQDIRAIYTHNRKVAQQYYWLRWISGAVAIVAPWIILSVVIFGLACEGFLGKLHPAVQGLLVSGAFVSFMVLYGVVLQGMFRPLKDKPAQDMRQNNPHDDLAVPPDTSKFTDHIPDEWKQVIQETFRNPAGSQ